MNRRRLLAGTAAAACSLAAAGRWMRGAVAQRAVDAAIAAAASESICRTSAIFDTPLRIPGADGLLGDCPLDRPLRLIAAAAELPVSGRRLPGLAFAAERGDVAFLDPTLRLRTGARVDIELDNALDEPTVVHWHGLAVDTANDGSGIHHVEPGARKRYVFTVRDPASMYWYHPHPHGRTAGQIARGMLGMLWVDDEREDALRRALDLVPGDNELALVLGDVLADSPLGYDVGQDRLVGVYGNEALVNFTTRALLEVDRGLHRLRIVNASNARNFRLALCDEQGGKRPLRVIGVDGGRLARTHAVTEVFVSPAERVDLLVDLGPTDAAQPLWLWSLPFAPAVDFDSAGSPRWVNGAVSDGASTSPGESHGPSNRPGESHGPSNPPGERHAAAAMPGATHRPSATPAESDTLAEPGTRGALPRPVETRDREQTRRPPLADGVALPLLKLVARSATRRPMKLDQHLGDGTGQEAALPDFAGAPVRSFRLGFARRRWRINDRVYRIDDHPVDVARGSREVWLIRNYYTSMPHAMHLHGFHFRVLDRQNSPDAIAALAVAGGRLPTDLGPKDTVLVWPGETVRLGLDFALPFAGAQTYLFHCHNLEHEDQGMMLNVRVA